MVALVFLGQMFFGWAQYLSIAFTQLGVEQTELGVSGGLAGTARYAGASCAGGMTFSSIMLALTTICSAICATILSNSQASSMAKLVPAAAIGAGLPASSVPQLLAGFSLGTDALLAVPGINPIILAAASTAFK